jgi:nucleotide-binding universal stress UspA family protein
MEGLPPFQLEAQGFDVKRYREVLEADLQEQLRKVVPDGAKDWCKPRTTVVEGKSWQRLLDVAKETHADLIVLGVHGRNPLDVMLFGSTTHHVIRGAEAPVWTVRG